MSEQKKQDEQRMKPGDLGTGLLSKAAQALVDRKKRQQQMNKRFGIQSKPKSNDNN